MKQAIYNFILHDTIWWIVKNMHICRDKIWASCCIEMRYCVEGDC